MLSHWSGWYARGLILTLRRLIWLPVRVSYLKNIRSRSRFWMNRPKRRHNLRSSQIRNHRRHRPRKVRRKLANHQLRKNQVCPRQHRVAQSQLVALIRISITSWVVNGVKKSQRWINFWLVSITTVQRISVCVTNCRQPKWRQRLSVCHTLWIVCRHSSTLYRQKCSGESNKFEN